MQREKRRKTEKEVREAVRANPTLNAAARALGISADTLSKRLNRGNLHAWWAPLKAQRKRLRRAARDRRTWNRRRDRELVAWACAHREGFRARRHLSSRLRRRLEAALARQGVILPPL